MNSDASQRGLTRVDALVVVIAIAALAALLLPAIQRGQRGGARAGCRNNLKTIVIGLQAYHDKYAMFPMGVAASGRSASDGLTVDPALGPSWWFAVLPFTENQDVYDRIMETQRPGGPESHQFCADDMNAAGAELDRFVPLFMRCRSSPLPWFDVKTATQQGPILLPTYVGVAGGCDIDPDSPDYAPDVEVHGPAGISIVKMSPLTSRGQRVYRNEFKGTGAVAGGIVTASGMLPPCRHVRISDCTDGTSNVMMVAEQSDWLRDRNRDVTATYHGDPGWTVGGTGAGGGFLSGTAGIDPVPRVAKPGGEPAPWGVDCWNITTVRYRPQWKQVLGANPLPGCSENHGINNPLQSPHPGGLLIGMTDGSVPFLSGTVDLAVVLRLAVRHDGQPVKLD